MDRWQQCHGLFRRLDLHAGRVLTAERAPRKNRAYALFFRGTIDGFTFQDSINTAFTGYGIWLNPGVSGTHLINNTIKVVPDKPLRSAAVCQADANDVILIRNNNKLGPASGHGIYTDQFVGGSVVEDVLIEENAFVTNNVAGIDVSNTDAAGGAFNLDISKNSFDMNGRAVLLFNTHQSSFHDNSVTASTEALSAAVRILDNNSELSITFNERPYPLMRWLSKVEVVERTHTLRSPARPR